ncbi:MAG: HepT-like ribonuclease domain-containing protein [Anaerolineae bacterium]
MQRETKKYSYDILQATDLLKQFAKGKTFADYEENALLRSGVERQFEIIGESLNRLSWVAPDVVMRISDYQRIISFRNLLIHDIVDDKVVWGVLQGRSGKLQDEVEAMLREDGAAAGASAGIHPYVGNRPPWPS